MGKNIQDEVCAFVREIFEARTGEAITVTHRPGADGSKRSCRRGAVGMREPEPTTVSARSNLGASGIKTSGASLFCCQ
jgi:hypothetical protein